MVLYNGSSHGAGKYTMYVNGSTHGAVACGHLITNNWFGTLGEYDSSVSAGQDTTAGSGQVALVAGTTRFVENHIQPVYTGGVNLNVSGKRNIVLFNHVANGGSYGADIAEDNVVFSGNLVYWNDAKGTTAEPFHQYSSVDRMVLAGNRGGNKASIATNATNSQVGNNELGTL